jgi:hypothetical protein
MVLYLYLDSEMNENSGMASGVITVLKIMKSSNVTESELFASLDYVTWHSFYV